MRLLAATVLLCLCTPAAAREPILDMHLHARKAGCIGPNPPPMCAPFEIMPRFDTSKQGEERFEFARMPPCPRPIPPAATDEQVLRDTLAVMEKYNIVGMVSGEPELMAAWKKAAPDRIIVGLDLRVGVDGAAAHVAPRTPAEVRKLHEQGRFEVLGEVMAQYEGLAADDAIEKAPFLDAAQKRDILYENAARFLRLDDATRARHRALGQPRAD